MISESVPVPGKCTESPAHASDQSIRRDAFEVYKQEQAQEYSRLNDKNVRLQKLDQSNRENTRRILKELASKIEEAQEAQMDLYDTQAELDACKEEQKRLGGH